MIFLTCLFFSARTARANSSIGFTCTGRTYGKYDIVFIGFLHHSFLVSSTGAYRFTVRPEYQYFMRIAFLKIINTFRIVATKDLLKIIFHSCDRSAGDTERSGLFFLSLNLPVPVIR